MKHGVMCRKKHLDKNALIELCKNAYAKTIGSELDSFDTNGVWRNPDGSVKTEEQQKQAMDYLAKIAYALAKWEIAWEHRQTKTDELK